VVVAFRFHGKSGYNTGPHYVKGLSSAVSRPQFIYLHGDIPKRDSLRFLFAFLGI